MEMFDKLSLAGLIPVIKVEDAADAVPLCRALANGGLPVAEITFRTAAAAQAIANVHAELPDVMLGAGTVITTKQVDRAIEAGATYIVSPGLNPEVVKYCQQKGITVLPGCANPSDLEVAISLGLNTVKFFPAEALGGLKLIKAMSAPYGAVSFVPTGGVNEANCQEYLAFSKIRAVGGSWMVPDDAIKQKDWARIEQLTRQAVMKILGLTLTNVQLPSQDTAADANVLCALFGANPTDIDDAICVGSDIALSKNAKGKLTFSVNHLDRAIWHFARRGLTFNKCESGKCATLGTNVAGFDVCIKQK